MGDSPSPRCSDINFWGSAIISSQLGNKSLQGGTSQHAPLTIFRFFLFCKQSRWLAAVQATSGFDDSIICAYEKLLCSSVSRNRFKPLSPRTADRCPRTRVRPQRNGGRPGALGRDVGVAVLKSGGNAIEAAVAVGFALAVSPWPAKVRNTSISRPLPVWKRVSTRIASSVFTARIS